MLGCELKASIDESSKAQTCSDEEEPWVEILTQGYISLRLDPHSSAHPRAGWAASAETAASRELGCSQNFPCHLSIKDLYM